MKETDILSHFESPLVEKEIQIYKCKIHALTKDSARGISMSPSHMENSTSVRTFHCCIWEPIPYTSLEWNRALGEERDCFSSYNSICKMCKTDHVCFLNGLSVHFTASIFLFVLQTVLNKQLLWNCTSFIHRWRKMSFFSWLCIKSLCRQTLRQ